MHIQSLSSSFSPFPSIKHANHSRHRPETHHHQIRQTEPGTSRTGANERSQKIVDRQLLDRLEKTIGGKGDSFDKLNADDFSPDKVADRVLAFVNQAYGRLQNSQPDFDKEAFMDQVKQGIDTGFKEARDILSDLGVLNGRIAEDINATYDRIQEGLNRVEPDTNPGSLSSLALHTQAAELSRSAQIEIRTQEGDVIKIGLQQSLSKTQSVFEIEQDNVAVSGFHSDFSSSSDLAISVEGNLNEDEQASVKHLLKQMNKVGNAFFNGNIKSAFHHASRLGIDPHTIAGVSMDLGMSQSVQAVTAYQQTRLPEQSVQSNSIKQASDFFTQAKEMLSTARSALASFESPLSAFNDLFAGVNQTVQKKTGESNSEDSNALMNQLIKPLGQSILNEELTRAT